MNLTIFGIIAIAGSMYFYVYRPEKFPTFIIPISILGATAGLEVTGRPVQVAILILPIYVLSLFRFKRTPELLTAMVKHNQPYRAYSVFVVYSIIITLFSGLIFEDQIYAFTPSEYSNTFELELIQLGGNQFAQITYLICSFIFFIGLTISLNLNNGIKSIKKGIIILSISQITAGFLDLISHEIFNFDILSFLKNANYTIRNDELAGLKRIAGTFSESSTYATLSVGLIAYHLFIDQDPMNKKLHLLIAISLTFLTVMTTSSSGYFGLTLIGILYILKQRVVVKKILLKYALFTVSMIFVFLLYIKDNETVTQIIRITLTEKSVSESGIERALWNKQALINLYDSSFLGIGLGSNRASSLIIVLLSNVGVIGFALYMIFLISALRNSSSRYTDPAISAAKYAAISTLGVLAVNATSLYRGLFIILLLALCSDQKNRKRIDHG